MKILMATITNGSHTTQGIPIAKSLVEHGHEVRWYNSPRFKDKIESTGAQYLPLVTGFDLHDSKINEQFPERQRYEGLTQVKWDIKNFVFRISIGYTQDLLAILQDYDADIILGDIGGPAPLFTSELSGIPCVIYSPLPMMLSSRDTAPFGPAFLPGSGLVSRLRNRIMYWMLGHVIMRDVQAHLNQVRAELSLPPIKEFAFDAIARRCDLFLQGTTPAFEYPRSDLPDHVHFIGPLLPDAASDFVPPDWWDDLETDKPVVHVTQGTVETDLDNLVLPTIQGLDDENVLVVATTGKAPVRDVEFASLPDNLRLERFIPHAQLLPCVDVMVTNGGYGGTQMALSHGVPLVASGHSEDKPEVCARIEWSGAGINLRAKKPSPEQVKQAVYQVLREPSYKQAANRIQKEFAQYDAPTRAVDLIEKLVANN